MALAVFMGTPDFAVPVLEALLGAHQVVGVYTRPDEAGGRGLLPLPSPVKVVAQSEGLLLFQPKSLKGGEEETRLRGLAPELIVVAAYGLLLPPEVLRVPPAGCLNVHPSLLPRHRGPSPIAAAILAGDEETGVSLMLMDEGVDTGPLLAQERLPVGPQDTTFSLGQKLSRLGAHLLLKALPGYLKGERRPSAQQGEPSYTRLIRKEEGEMDWNLPALSLWLRVRAFYPWPGTFTSFKGRRLRLLEAFPHAVSPPLVAGRVRAWEKGAGVETGEGVLELLTVQLEGRRPLPVEEFLRGQRDFVGAVLPS
jgi:methionyl-tRNA formyltransferase